MLCDVDIDANHVLLGRSWQFDVDNTHKGKENLTLSLGTSGTSPFYPTNQIVITPRRRGK
jgi:hypothetical protein